MNNRRGIMLLEIAVTITVTAALLYGMVSLFLSLQRIDRSARERFQISRELLRLAEQFRIDVHEAQEVESLENKSRNADRGRPLVRLTLEGEGHIEYQIGETGQVNRTVANGENIIERDAFDVGASDRVSIDVAVGPHPVITLVIKYSSGSDAAGDATSSERRITALLGRNHRYRLAMKEEPSP